MERDKLYLELIKLLIGCTNELNDVMNSCINKISEDKLTINKIKDQLSHIDEFPQPVKKIVTISSKTGLPFGF